MIKNISESTNPESELEELLNQLHRQGPIDNNIIENLTYYKIFHPNQFRNIEDKIISALGLFYKNTEPQNLYSFILSQIGKYNKDHFGEYLTPVQASIRIAIEKQQYVSISAPTSAGKSFSIKDYISAQRGDSVIIVPSRALIAEYIKTMRELFKNDKNIMISSFVDNVFTDRQLRRIFILTPERSRELFLPHFKFNISFFFFDEAQVSEDKNRGIKFDVLVRRVQKTFPEAKLVFAHPFVDNPDAQMKKHDLDEAKSYSRSYSHNTVGKAFVFKHSNGHDYYFSPFTEKGHCVANSIKWDTSFENFAFSGNKSVLIYVSKASVYDGRFIADFEKHIRRFPVIQDKKALEIINAVENLLGANNNEHRSNLVSLLKQGVVIHHGSVPLDVRFLVEDFIKGGYARICFATSTLAQGINMPFDIVWLANMRMHSDTEEERALSFKNLIGRSGRLSKNPQFDYGYVYTKNPKLLSQKINTPFALSEQSVLDMPIEDDNDQKELINSIVDGTFNDEINLPPSKIERLSKPETTKALQEILYYLYTDEFGSLLFSAENRPNREIVKNNLLLIYQASLGRTLFDGEATVFSSAIEILFHVIQGRSFKEIVGIRYSYASNRGGNRNELAPFFQPAQALPDSNLINSFSLFKETKARNVSYDAVVFDTYDYLDTVISFSLSDVFIGAFSIYYKNTRDPNALKTINLLKYGTNDEVHTLLLRYGFPPEEITEIAPYIQSISEQNINFKENIYGSEQKIRDLVEWYLP